MEDPDFLARAGITDDDFDDAPVVEAPEEAAQAEEVVEPVTDDRPRDEHGRFAPKQAEPKTEAAEETPPVVSADPPPDLNLTPAEREKWAAVPPEVRSGVERRLREMQNGIERYRGAVDTLRPFIDMAGGNVGQLAQAIQSYVGIENTLRENPIAGFEQIAKNLGTDFRTVASHYLGQPAPEKDKVIDGLRQEIAALRQHIAPVTQHVRQTSEQQTQQRGMELLQEFAKDHPRINEPAFIDTIARMIQTKFVDTADPDWLPRAYDMADRMMPAYQPAPAAMPANPPAEPRKPADFSISGAPATGSNPNPRTPSRNRREGIEWALTQAGI